MSFLHQWGKTFRSLRIFSFSFYTFLPSTIWQDVRNGVLGWKFWSAFLAPAGRSLPRLLCWPPTATSFRTGFSDILSPGLLWSTQALQNVAQWQKKVDETQNPSPTVSCIPPKPSGCQTLPHNFSIRGSKNQWQSILSKQLPYSAILVTLAQVEEFPSFPLIYPWLPTPHAHVMSFGILWACIRDDVSNQIS